MEERKKTFKKQGFKNLCRWILRPFWFLAGILWWTRREEPCCYHHGKDGEGNDMDQWQEHWSLLGLILVSPSKAYSIWVSVQILILHFHWVKIKMLIMELWNLTAGGVFVYYFQIPYSKSIFEAQGKSINYLWRDRRRPKRNQDHDSEQRHNMQQHIRVSCTQCKIMEKNW